MEIEEELTLAESALSILRKATAGTKYEGKLYLVGGALRDRALGVPHGADLDLVLEGDALALAQLLFDKGVSTHFPVLYPRFGTAMIHVAAGDSGVDVELVSARAESYQPDSRKPDVRTGTLKEDIYRRDFTINTLAENLHTGEMLDITGKAMADIRSGIVRTPVEPQITFFDDPLRMLRAVRFASRFGFLIENETWNAIKSESQRLRPPTIALERIREEFVKIAQLPGKRFRAGMELLLTSGLLAEFLPEMLPMIGCTQGAWHRHDVWEHTLLALEALPNEVALEARLGLLWHDIGKPATRTESREENSESATGAVHVHFYGHPGAGAETTRTIMNRLKFSNEEIWAVVFLVKNHMRLGDYRPGWDDAAVKRLIRDTHLMLGQLFTLTACDRSAVDIPPEYAPDLTLLRSRMDALMGAVSIVSPLDGNEIMQILGVGEGPHLREAKEFLVNAVIDGKLEQNNQVLARQMVELWWRESKSKLMGTEI